MHFQGQSERPGEEAAVPHHEAARSLVAEHKQSLWKQQRTTAVSFFAYKHSSLCSVSLYSFNKMQNFKKKYKAPPLAITLAADKEGPRGPKVTISKAVRTQTLAWSHLMPKTHSTTTLVVDKSFTEPASGGHATWTTICHCTICQLYHIANNTGVFYTLLLLLKPVELAGSRRDDFNIHVCEQGATVNESCTATTATVVVARAFQEILAIAGIFCSNTEIRCGRKTT